jgi:CTD nuclear envelope phosphatase 1
MNSVNILSAVASAPSTSPQPSRSASTSALTPTTDCNKRNSIESEKEPDRGNTSNTSYRDSGEEGRNSASQGADYSMEIDEQTPLLGEAHVEHFSDVKSTTGWAGIPKRFSSAFVGTIRVVVTTVAIPLRYVVACLFDEQGHFSPLLPFFSIYRVFAPRRRKRSQHSMSDSEKTDTSWDRKSGKLTHQSDRPPSIASASTIVATDSEMDEKLGILGDEESRQPSKSGRTRSSMSSGDEISPARRSIRIKLHNDEMIKRKRQQLQDIGSGQASNEDVKDMMAATLKSPSSPGLSKLTKFPRAPAPPRPLIPRRQPSYSNAAHHGPHQKTLIIDLDETLIHSHSKGGRFATGHMVEVKIQQSVGVGGQFLGPQVPILYYVHKRPHCDEFLRKVCGALVKRKT